MEVELVQVLMRSISSLSIREIRLTTTGKFNDSKMTSAQSENPNVIIVIKSVNPKISRIGRQKRKNNFFSSLTKRTHLVNYFRK